jgi:hypothetical protein
LEKAARKACDLPFKLKHHQLRLQVGRADPCARLQCIEAAGFKPYCR